MRRIRIWICALATILTLIGVFVPDTVDAQPVSYGIKGGLSLSTISSEFPSDIDPDYSRTKGLTLLGFGEWRAAPVFSVVGEIGYTQRGYKSVLEARNEQGERIGEFTQTTSFGYGTTAVLAKTRYPAALTPYLLAGPHLSVLIHSSFDAPELNESENAVTQQYDGLTYGGIVGAGFETDRLLFERTFLEVRYNADIPDSFSDAPREIRNRTINVILGISF